MQWVFSPFFSSLPEKIEAKIRIVQFLCIYPPPTKINERSLSDSLPREKIGVLLIVLSKNVNSDLWQERVDSSLQQPLTKKSSPATLPGSWKIDLDSGSWLCGKGKHQVLQCLKLPACLQPTCMSHISEPVLSCHAVPVAQSTAVTGASYRRKHIALVLPHPNDVWEQGREAWPLLIYLCFIPLSFWSLQSLVASKQCQA